MSRRKILLHVGHGKTGTSFLQSAFANSIDALAAAGISYPLADKEVERVRKGGISSGNGTPAPGHLRKMVTRGDETLLLSNEGLFFRLKPHGLLDVMRENAPEADFEVLIYVRDPMDHAVSKYQQQVKRGGSTETFEEFLKTYNHPAVVANFIRWLEAQDIPVHVRNYSRHRSDLLQSFEALLGVSTSVLTPPDVKNVNRSMTNSEIALQIAFNKTMLTAASKFISDPLCEQLPNIRSERPEATPEALDAFLKRMTRLISQHGLDARLGEAERYHIPPLDEVTARFDAPDPERTFSFSRAQLEVLVASVSEEIRTGSSVKAENKARRDKREMKARKRAKADK